MASFIYKQAKKDLVDGTHEWDSLAQTYRVLLVGPAYVPDAAHVFVSDLGVGAEVSGAGYVGGFGGSGRKALTGRTVTLDPVFDRSELDADDVAWPGLGVGTVSGLVVFREGTSDADSKVIAHVDGGGLPLVMAGQRLEVAWNPEGLIQLT